jgi:predicted cupin superfamily sugar epimerase
MRRFSSNLPPGLYGSQKSFPSLQAYAYPSIFHQMRTAEEWITTLGLVRHPEGGYFRETYRSDEVLAGEGLPARFGGSRPLSTTIYYLLRQGDVSRLHRLKSDEVWHFYDGDPLALFVLQTGGTLAHYTLGTDIAQGERPQVVVPRGEWLGAAVKSGGDYALVGCTVAPGFTYEDFELADRGALIAQYPEHRDLIIRLA